MMFLSVHRSFVRSMLVALSALALILSSSAVGLATTKDALSDQGAAPSLGATGGLQTSWPAVPQAERLQPWLEQTLENAQPSSPLRVIVSGETTDSAVDAASAAGLTIQEVWSSVGIVVAIGTPAQVSTVVGEPGVTYVEGDQPLEYKLDTAHKATRSDEALEYYKAPDGSRVDGTGVSVAVIDSGIDGTHPFFEQDGASKVVRNMENVCTVVSGPSETCYQDEPTNDTDTNSAGGHGTHVAGIAGGVEVTAASDSGGEEVALRGSAPDAKLIGLSVGAALGLVNANSAMNWVLEHQSHPCNPATEAGQTGPLDPGCPPIRVTNHSYGPATTPEGGHKFDPNSSTVRLQRQLVALGVVPVWAAGNSGGDGSEANTNPPGMDPTPGVLMVASYNDGQNGNPDNAVSGFSSRGEEGDPTTYPDLSAPGDLITSSCRPTLAICTGAPSYDGGNYQTISGTSMAAPYAAGALASLFESNPGLTPGEAEDILEDTAHKFTAGGDYEPDPRNTDDTTSFDKGHGLIDLLALLADAQGLPPPGEPAPVCTTTSVQMEDPAGDATQAVIIETPAPSEPSLDLRKAWLTWNGTAKELTFHIRVTNLSAGPPTGSAGEYFRLYFTRETDPELYVVANRKATGGESFSLRQFGGKNTALEGAFDEASNEISVVLPAAKYSEVLEGETISEGNVIGVGQVLGQRDNPPFTLTADTAAGSCPFTVGTTTPDPTDPPDEEEEPTLSPRDITLEGSKEHLDYGKPFQLSGVVNSRDESTPPECTQGVDVKIKRDVVGGSNDYRVFAETTTGEGGAFSIEVPSADRSASYVASVRRTNRCAAATSDTDYVMVRKVTRIRLSDRVVTKGQIVTIFGHVSPCAPPDDPARDHAGGRVRLQKASNGTFGKIGAKRTDESCRVVFRRRVYRETVFRLSSSKDDADHLRDFSGSKVVEVQDDRS